MTISRLSSAIGGKSVSLDDAAVSRVRVGPTGLVDV
jgi:hypothetical protein